MEFNKLNEEALDNVTGGYIDNGNSNYKPGMECPSCHKGHLDISSSTAFHKHGGFERYYECDKCHCLFTD